MIWHCTSSAGVGQCELRSFHRLVTIGLLRHSIQDCIVRV